MPSGKVHVQIGAVIAGIVLFLVHKFQDSIPFIKTELTGIDWVILVVIVYLASQLPDIDQDISTINKIWNTTAGAVGLYTLYIGKYKILGYFAIASIVALEWIKHRGVTHTVPFVAVMSAPLWVVNPLFSIVFFVCGLSHIIADGDLGR